MSPAPTTLSGDYVLTGHCKKMRRAAGLLAVCGLLATWPGDRLLASSALDLRVEVVEGDGAINNITAGRARDPVVRVTSGEGAPLAGAAVTFLLPELGAGGAFPAGSMVTVTTAGDGLASARGLRPNNVAGQFQIRVTASYRSQVARASITQTNAEAPGQGMKRSGAKWMAVVAILGGGVAAGAALALTGGRTAAGGIAPAPAPTLPAASITPGGGSFGAP
ncbi:MAG: carboxypeptidase regulatory-like domain-containing protein [Bryobacterales bacterium]|nr:carboxypeptidase regulatory-like domain-containing protein [Bryobacterales bacterium]